MTGGNVTTRGLEYKGGPWGGVDSFEDSGITSAEDIRGWIWHVEKKPWGNWAESPLPVGGLGFRPSLLLQNSHT